MIKKYNWETAVIEELMIKYNLPKRIIVSIVHSQFHLVAKKAAKEKKTVILPFFGKFAVTKGKRKFWEEYDKSEDFIKGNRYNNKSLQGLDTKQSKQEDSSTEEIKDM